jgi:hypothetical protein
MPATSSSCEGTGELPNDAYQAAATDLASVITLANELRAALVEKGLIKGGA